MKVQDKVKKHPASLRDVLATLDPAGVLTWALAMLTASYMGYAKIDAAFISSLVTSVLAVYGISRREEPKKPNPPQIRTTPTAKRTTKPPP